MHPFGCLGVVVALACAVSCVPKAPKAPRFTGEQMICLGEVEAVYRLRVAACGENIEGNCSTDALINRQKAEACEQCFKGEKC